MKEIHIELQPCSGNRTGIGIYTFELAKRLKCTDDIEFRGNIFNFLKRNDYSSLLAELDMSVRQCNLIPYGVYRRIWDKLPDAYEFFFGGGADLSLFFNYLVPNGIKGKTSVAIYDMTYERFPETMERKNFNRLKNNIIQSVERSDRIITISEFSKKEISELLDISPEKITVIPCAPSVSGSTVDFGELTARLGFEKPYILFVGTIEPRKNISRLLRAFEYLKKECGIPHRLVLAGGNGWGNDEIYHTAEQIYGGEDVVFTGYISESEKNTLYRHASAFVFPSLYEGFGIPPLEAMCWECPVIAADAASLPEVVGDAACLVNPNDSLSIANELYRVLSDDSLKADLIRKGTIRASHFTWDRSAEKLVDMCRDMLSD